MYTARQWWNTTLDPKWGRWPWEWELLTGCWNSATLAITGPQGSIWLVGYRGLWEGTVSQRRSTDAWVVEDKEVSPRMNSGPLWQSVSRQGSWNLSFITWGPSLDGQVFLIRPARETLRISLLFVKACLEGSLPGGIPMAWSRKRQFTLPAVTTWAKAVHPTSCDHMSQIWGLTLLPAQGGDGRLSNGEIIVKSWLGVTRVFTAMTGGPQRLGSLMGLSTLSSLLLLWQWGLLLLLLSFQHCDSGSGCSEYFVCYYFELIFE